MRRLLGILTSAITIGVGLVLIFDLTLGPGIIAPWFLRLAVVTLAIMIVAGILNLIIVHGGRVASFRRGWFYSLILLVSTALTIGVWLAGQTQASDLLLNYVQVSIESALAALLLFALVYGAYRILHRRFTWAGLVFVGALLIMLVGALPLEELGILKQIREWMLTVPASAGARGILLGIALGTIVTSVRILIAQDRSYRE
jgi:hypothetical protein